MSHDVEFTIPKRELGRADIEFVVKKNGSNLGTLKISKGSLVWFPGKTTKNGLKLTWGEFDDCIREYSHKRESR